MKKENNKRRYPGIKGRRPDKAQKRRDEAEVRQLAYNDLSIEARIMHLDALFGPNLGAARERAKLHKLAGKPIQNASEEVLLKELSAEAQQELDEINASNKDRKKKLKAKDRRQQEKTNTNK